MEYAVSKYNDGDIEQNGLFKLEVGLYCSDCFQTRREASQFVVDHLNALQGIPTESLPEVKKAWLVFTAMKKFGRTQYFSATNHVGMYLERCEHREPLGTFGSFGFPPSIEDRVISALKTMRDGGADFGELNALIDSVKE